MKPLSSIIHRIIARLSAVRLRRRTVAIGVSAVVGLTVLGATVNYLLPANIAFSYADTTNCVFRPTLAPSLLESDDQSFDLTHTGGFAIGMLPVFASHLCVTPTALISSGQVMVRTQPFGPTVHVNIPDAPTVTRTSDQKLAATAPLSFQLSSADAISRYQLTIKDQSTDCELTDTTLHCPLEPFQLSQDSQYDYQLSRSISGSEPAAVHASTVATLEAVTVESSSMTSGQTVYDKPRHLLLTATKPLQAATVRVTYREADQDISIDTTTTIDDRTITVDFAADLPRERDVTLTVEQADAVDSSQLAAPHTVTFHTSGPPQVTGINIAHTNVNTGSRVVVTLDQPITDTGLDRLVTINDQPVTVTHHDKSLHFTLPTLDRCQSFTINVAAGLVGEGNGLKSPQPWHSTHRIACGTSRVIGSSVNGRPITAYFFGSSSGSTTLFTGGMHGEEQSGASTMDAWVAYLQNNAQNLPPGKQIVVVPRVNPDGLAANTRLNARGVNIDRNFPSSDWQTDIHTSGGYYPTGGGSSAASEPETQALMNLSNQLRPQLSISYHAQGRLIGGIEPYASRYASAVGYRLIGSNPEETFGYAITGEYETWLSQVGIRAILIELPTKNSNYLKAHQSIMWQLASE